MFGMPLFEAVLIVVWLVLTLVVLVRVLQLAHLPFMKRTLAVVLTLLIPIVGALLSLFLLTRWSRAN